MRRARARGALRCQPCGAGGAPGIGSRAASEARISWTRPAAEVDRAIRGFPPFPGAGFERDGARIKALLSQVEAGAGAPGEALDDAGLIACGQGAVRLLRLQKAGRGPLPATDFLRGTPHAAGTSLG